MNIEKWWLYKEYTTVALGNQLPIISAITQRSVFGDKQLIPNYDPVALAESGL